MNENPYQPPESAAYQLKNRKIYIKAVFIGILFGAVVGYFVDGMEVKSFITFNFYSLFGVSYLQLLSITTFVILGSGVSFCAGVLIGKLVKQDEILNAGIAGTIILMINLPFHIYDGIDDVLFYVYHFFKIPITMLGGDLVRRKRISLQRRIETS